MRTHFADSLDDLRRTVRMHVIDDILQMLNAVGQGRTRDDAVMAMASAPPMDPGRPASERTGPNPCCVAARTSSTWLM